MRKMRVPPQDPLATFDACVEAIGNLAVRNLYAADRQSIAQKNADFDAASQIADWASLPRVANGNGTAVITGALSKQKLMDLYTSYMVNAKGASRKIYDDLLIAAGGLCPFCGGLGHTWTRLDT